jgi:uncharacterized protein YbaP (TraB family)
MKFNLNFKKSFSLGFLITLYLNINAQNNNVNSLCWKVTGPGLNQPSYIFGTIHLISKKDFFLSKSVETAFKSCKTLALEVDLNMDKETKKDVGKSAILPEGKTISDYCSTEEMAIIKSFMSDSVKISGLKIKLYSRLKPIYLQSILLKEQLKGDKSYEETFAKKAKKNNMNQVGLEAINLQMKILDTIPIATQIKDMVSSIKEGKASIRNFNEMIAVYKSQNIEKLHQLTIDEDSGINNFEDVFLNNRNESWIPVIENLISKQPTFIAVGAAHLGGTKGVLNLMKLKGYVIEPIF